MVGPDETLIGGLVAAATLFLVNYIFGLFFARSKKFSNLLEGHPLMLIYEGHVMRENLLKSEISEEELEAVVREHGVEKVSQVDLAILEIDGNISVLSNDFTRKTVRRRRAHKVITKNM